MKLSLNLCNTSRVMLAAVSAVCFVMLILGLLIINFIYPFEEPLAFTFGLVVGCIQSMLKVILLEKSISKIMDMTKERAAATAQLLALARYALVFAIFAAVIAFDAIGLFGAILGVLSLQLASYITNFILNKKMKT